jgi:hypothetical protein
VDIDSNLDGWYLDDSIQCLSTRHMVLSDWKPWLVRRCISVEEVVSDYHSGHSNYHIYQWIDQSLWSLVMEDKDNQILKLTNDVSWCINILERIDEFLSNQSPDEFTVEDLRAISWLVKQGLKVRRED